MDSHPMEQAERYHAEGADTQFGQTERRQDGQPGDPGYHASCQTAQPEAQHECAHDDRDRFDIDPVDSEQRALPDDLVDERWEPRNKEEHIYPEDLRRRSVARVLLRGLHINGPCDQRRGVYFERCHRAYLLITTYDRCPTTVRQVTTTAALDHPNRLYPMALERPSRQKCLIET
jgi:hypothetical protein